MPEVRVSEVLGVLGLELVAELPGLDPSGPLPASGASVRLSGASEKSVSFFDRAAHLSARAGADLGVVFSSVGDRAIDPFGNSLGLGPLERWADFRISGTLEAAGNAGASSGAWRFSVAASGGAELTYRHLLAIGAQESARSALRRVVASARRPSRFLDSPLAPSEFHLFESRVRIEVEAGALGGWKGELRKSVDLFSGFSDEIVASARASVEAAIGLALHESVRVVVGRSDAAESREMRLRIERTKSRGLTLGARIDLAAKQNVGSLLAAVLDHVFGLEPVAGALSALRELSANAAEGNWDALVEKLSRKASDTLLELLGSDRLADSEALRALAKTAGEVLASYDALDERLQDLWADLLEHLDLAEQSKIRDLLTRIAALEGQTFQQMVDTILPEARKPQVDSALSLLELLAGRSIDELLGATVEDARGRIESAAKAAQRALDFLDEEAVADLSGLLHAYAKKTGIEGVVAWLRENATSPEALKAAMERPVRRVVCTLLQKAWEDLALAEVEKIRAWAARVGSQLDKLETWRARAREDLERIDQELGFSLALEMSRQLHEEALLDVDVPEELREDLAEGLREGDLRALLRTVSELGAREDDDGVARIRECALLSRRTRKFTWSTLSRAFGIERLTSSGSTRLVEISDRIEAGAKKRSVRILGRSERSFAKHRESFVSFGELSIAGGGGAIGGSFEPSNAGIVLGVHLEDDKAVLEELEAIDRLLADTGFGSPAAPTAKGLLATLGAAPEIRFGLQLSFSGPLDRLIAALADDPGDVPWKEEAIGSAIRWFQDGLVTKSEAALPPKGQRTGAVLAALAADAKVAEKLKVGSPDTRALLVKMKTCKVEGKTVSLVSQGGSTLLVPIQALPQLADVIGTTSRDKASALELAGVRAREKKGPDDFAELANRFANYHNKLRALGYADNPMLGFWMLRTKLAKAAAEGRLQVRGCASLRWYERTAERWSGPLLWLC